jgi:2,3,4,5-tetrahydropyridine-2-carboxylate N-succinyltransferase
VNQGQNNSNQRTDEFAWGWGLATIAFDGTILDTWFPNPNVGNEEEKQAAFTQATEEGEPENLLQLSGPDQARGVNRKVMFVCSDLYVEPNDAKDVYLRLHILSYCLVRPNTINLDNIFSKLANVVWTNFGPCQADGFELTRLRLQQKFGFAPTVLLIDKFPRMVDYVIPKGVRIGNADRVRLGAHLAPGTTVMHEGFCNYNAGTLGTCMIEGRISQGVIVEDGSDVGGGASIMGTLSGGGKIVNSIGKRSLLGANSGLGFPLGDDCIIEAGLYITAGTKVVLEGEVFKAKELAYAPGLLFIRNSLTGQIEVKRRKLKTAGVELNSSLHQN